MATIEMEYIKETVKTYISLIFKRGLLITVLATFFLFTNLTTEFYDTPKFLVLLVFVALMLILMSAKYTLENKVQFIQTPFDLPLILLLAVSLVSTILSPSPYVAILGNQLKVHGSLVSTVVYILFYFVLTQNLKSQKDISWILNLCVFLGIILSLLGLLSFFGVKLLPFTFTHVTNFTPIGSSFSASAILAILLPILVSRILSLQNPILLTFNSCFLILFGITVALTGNLSTWIAALAGFFATLFVLNPVREINFRTFFYKPQLIAIITSATVIFAATVLSFVPPMGGAQNPFYNATKNFPREIQLPFLTSWKISVSTFRDSPFWGSGPGTYLFNFTSYKPVEFNQTKFWNIKFDAGFNEYLQILANLGGVGFFATLALTVIFVSKALSILRTKDPSLVGLSLAGMTFFVILLLHVSTLPTFVLGLIISACFWMKTLREEQNPSLLFKIANFSRAFEQNLRIEALPSILLVISVSLVLFTAFFGGKLYIADFHHRESLNAISKNDGILALNKLTASAKLNPWSDLYRTDLARVNFALANAIAQARGPTEASPAGSLSNQDKQNIQGLLQESIGAAKAATSLSPRSAVNWEILALLYRQIAGVAQNALLFSLDSYGRAIFNDPFDPALRLNVGGVYYAVKNYDLAIRFFQDSINLKPDFANGFYNLSVALRDKGDLNTALQAAERAVQLIDASSSDYKVATDYLNDLRAKAGGPNEPPAATASGALQEEKLPKVINLPKPEKIATPEAIRRSPSPSPTPKP
ncbi:MAG: O-antigen ligase family protein [Patescibacteria group bacterium]